MLFNSLDYLVFLPTVVFLYFPVLGPYPLPRLYLTESLLIGRRENAA